MWQKPSQKPLLKPQSATTAKKADLPRKPDVPKKTETVKKAEPLKKPEVPKRLETAKKPDLTKKVELVKKVEPVKKVVAPKKRLSIATKPTKELTPRTSTAEFKGRTTSRVETQKSERSIIDEPKADSLVISEPQIGEQHISEPKVDEQNISEPKISEQKICDLIVEADKTENNEIFSCNCEAIASTFSSEINIAISYEDYSVNNTLDDNDKIFLFEFLENSQQNFSSESFSPSFNNASDPCYSLVKAVTAFLPGNSAFMINKKFFSVLFTKKLELLISKIKETENSKKAYLKVSLKEFRFYRHKQNPRF